MGTVIATAVIVLLLGAAVFFSARKLWRDKKNGKTCCGGSCSCCPGCNKQKKSF